MSQHSAIEVSEVQSELHWKVLTFFKRMARTTSPSEVEEDVDNCRLRPSALAGVVEMEVEKQQQRTTL
ncbi:hypothetical protein ACFX2I_003353 [Malus domestica]